MHFEIPRPEATETRMFVEGGVPAGSPIEVGVGNDKAAVLMGRDVSVGQLVVVV